MKSTAKRFISLIVTLVMVFTVMSMTMMSMTAGAADTKTYTGIKDYTIEYGGQTYRGYILVPEKPGKYPVNIIYCGTGGIKKWKDYSFHTLVNKWIDNGYIKPSIIVLPSVIDNGKSYESGVGSDYNMFERNVRKQLGSMKEALLKSDYSSFIDARKDISVSGYSMGGCASLLAGTVYPNLYHHIGSFSPSYCYFTYDGTGWVKKAKDIVFSKSSRAKRLMSYSKGEGEPAASNFKFFEKESRNNGYRFKTYISKTDGHNVHLFARQIFVYMYFLDHNTVLTDSQLETMDYKTF